MKPRPYQRAAIDAVRAQWDNGDPNALVVLPTGAGKTIVFSVLGRELRQEGIGKILVLAHREELIAQARDKWTAVEPDANVGIYQGKQREVWADVICASIQSCYPDRTVERDCSCLAVEWSPEADAAGRLFSTRAKPDCFGCKGTGRVSVTKRGRLHDLPLADIGVLIVDECHHAPADSYVALIEAMRAANPNLLLLGVTATPYRTDGKGLGALWSRVAYRMGIADGIGGGFLVKPRGLRVELQIDLSKVKTSKATGDFIDRELGAVMDTVDARERIVDEWLANVGPNTDEGGQLGRKTIAFTPSVATAQHLAEEFVRRGIAADWISGEMKKDERRKRLAKFADGRLRVLVNCQIATEGFDEPSIACVLIARPTKSIGMYAQIVGRGLRLSPGKVDCIVMDCVGASALGLASLVDLSSPKATHVPGVDPDLEEEEPEEEPESTRSQDDLIPDEPRRVKIEGVATYEIDLFGGSVEWARIRGSRVAALGVGHSMVVFPSGNGTWTALALSRHPHLVASGPERETMKEAEAYAAEHGDPKYMRTDPARRLLLATDAQVQALQRLVRQNQEIDRQAPSASRLDPDDVPSPGSMARPQASLWIAYLTARVEWHAYRSRRLAQAAVAGAAA